MRPRRIFVPEAAVADAVAKLRDKFEYPEQVIPPLSLGFGAGGAPTIVVAASNASDFSKQKADLIAPGSGDEETIQTALDQLGATGGRILLTEGIFDITMAGSSFNVIRVTENVTIQGMGIDATILNISDEPQDTFDPVIFVSGASATIRDLTIQGGTGGNEAVGIWVDQSEEGQILNVRVNTTGVGVIGTFSDYMLISGCWLSGAKGIFLSSALEDCVITATRFENTGNCIEASGANAQCSLVSCHFTSTGGAGITGTFGQLLAIGNIIHSVGGHGFNVTAGGLVVMGNWFRAGSSGTAIRAVDATPDLIASDERLIVGNRIQGFQQGIVVIGHRGEIVIADNSVQSTTQHGVVIDNCHHAQVHHNLLHRIGVGSFNTYDAIRIVGSDRCKVDHNKILVPWLTGTGSTRYGVHVVSGSCNIVVGNDLGVPSGYGQDALGDFGTNTMIYYPAAGFYGDNFTDCPPGS